MIDIRDVEDLDFYIYCHNFKEVIALFKLLNKLHYRWSSDDVISIENARMKVENVPVYIHLWSDRTITKRNGIRPFDYSGAKIASRKIHNILDFIPLEDIY